MAKAADPGSATAAPAPTFDPPLQRCPLCGSGSLRRHDRDGSGRRIDRCAACGVRFLNPQYADAWLAQLYAHYVPPEGHDDPGRFRSRPDVRRAGKRRSLELIARHGGKGRILMGGCGDGLELLVARELGFEAEGQDVDPAATARAAARAGAPVHCAAFDRLGLPAASFDSVFLDQVIEHPKDPAAFLTAAHRLLRPGGVLYLGMPNIGSLANATKTLLGRLGLRDRRRGRHYAARHHIFYYSPAVLRRLLAGPFGFEVLEVRGSPKPARNRLLGAFVERVPFLDSSFAVIARKPAGPGAPA